MELENAKVRWFLSIDEKNLPHDIHACGQRTYRSIRVDGQEVEFSDGFTDLHTLSYEAILAGNGFGLREARPSIETVYMIRNSSPCPQKGERHPFARVKVNSHAK